MNSDIQSVLLTEEQIAARVRELGEKISRDYQGRDLTIVSILKGSVVFVSDLIRAVTIPVKLDFFSVSSYGKGVKSSGVVRILKDLDESVENQHVLIVEDILDSGRTLRYIMNLMETANPASLALCTLLDKPERRVEKGIECHYTGFTVPDEFLVGYGLDYDQQYRSLPYIGVLSPAVYNK